MEKNINNVFNNNNIEIQDQKIDVENIIEKKKAVVIEKEIKKNNELGSSMLHRRTVLTNNNEKNFESHFFPTNQPPESVKS